MFSPKSRQITGKPEIKGKLYSSLTLKGMQSANTKHFMKGGGQKGVFFLQQKAWDCNIFKEKYLCQHSFIDYWKLLLEAMPSGGAFLINNA